MLDVIIIVLALLAIVIGLWKGCAGLCFGLFGTFMCWVIASVISVVVAPFITYDGEGKIDSAFSSISQPISDTLMDIGGDFMNLTVLDGTTVMQDGNEIPLSEAISASDSIVAKWMATFGLTDLSHIIKERSPGFTLAEAFSGFCVQLIIEFILFITIFLILFIIKRIIRKKVFAWLDSNSTPSKVDRGVGVALCVISLLAIIWAVGYFGAGMSESFAELINQSVVGKVLMVDANLITLIIGN